MQVEPLPDGMVRQPPFFGPEAVYARDLAVGDYVSFDPFYGIEEILNAWPQRLTNDVSCVHLHVRRRDERSEGRFVVRAVHEPVTRWVAPS